MEMSNMYNAIRKKISIVVNWRYSLGTNIYINFI